MSSIGSGVFCSCTKLSSIYVDPKNEYFTFNEGILYDKNITKIITCLATKSPVTIPDSVTSIGDCAFIFCKNISNITLPDSLTEIGYQAFLGCDGLTTITIPESVTTISNNTFEYCDNLSSITIYDNVTKIGENAFYGCTSLTEVNYSGSLTKWKEIEIEEGNECLRNATLNHTYEVTWKNYDGSVLEKDEKLMFEEMPSYDGKTPTKENTAQYTYTFTGWSPKISPVTHDIAYTAQYKTTINTYTVTWENYDGTVLQTDPNVKYGVRPKYNGATPTQPKTAQYTYTFDKWSPDISIVKGDVTYKAQYKSSVNKYRVIWKNYDGKTLETDENVQYGTNPTYDGKTPTRESTEQYTYEFEGWSPEVSSVTGEIIYTAQFKPIIKTYTVTWKNYDGTVLATDKNAEYGKVPTYDGETPTKEKNAQYNYVFDKWSPEVLPVTGDVTYTAQFVTVVDSFTVTWKNYDGTVLKTNTNVEYGSVPMYYGTRPTREADAQYTYTFKGWDKPAEAITEDVVYTAEYKASVNKYVVTWKNYDGTVLETDKNIEYGTIPTYDGYVPTKPKTAQYTYTFARWSPDMSPVTGDVTYTAEYSSKANVYTVKWKNYDGTVLETDKNIEYGTIPTYDGVTPTMPKTAQYTYTFDKWSPDVSPVTGYSLAIQRYVINLKKLDSKQSKAADVDGDNKVTNKDAIIILRFTINIKVKYPIGELV